MKKLYLLFFITITAVTLLAQAPQSINYQAIMRGNSGWLWSNKDVNIKFTILQDSINGTEIYSEEHSTTTNVYGLLSIAIGSGAVLNGDFNTIPWGNNEHYLKFEVDTTNGTNYYEMGISQLLSVPYALYSERTGDTTMWRKNQSDALYYYNGQVGIGTVNPEELMHVNGIIRSDSSFNHQGLLGSTDTVNQITAFDFVNDKLKYKTYQYSGGILVYLSDESAWVDTVGGYIFPTQWACGDSLVDVRDGKKYGTVQIGTQCWLSQNLNVGTRIDGTSNQTDNSLIEKYCYNNEEDSCDVYGGLHQWNEMMQYVTDTGAQGICPTGWHIPTDYEWKILEMELGMSQQSADSLLWRGTIEGGKLKEAGYVHWITPNTGATNSSGFTGLPAGYSDDIGNFFHSNQYAHFWTSTETTTTWATIRELFYYTSRIKRAVSGVKEYGFTVRCLQDD